MIDDPTSHGVVDGVRARVRVMPSRPSSPRSVPSPVRELLTRAGVRTGHRILDVGGRLYDREMSSQELREFRVLGVDEDTTASITRLRPVDGAVSFRFTVHDINDLDLPRASFDAVVALDWWPSTPLAIPVARWRRILNPAGGVVIIVGTDIRVEAAGTLGASGQWIDELTAAGFRLEAAHDVRTAPAHYTKVVDDLRLASGRLRSVLGVSGAASYVAHAELLDQAARHGQTYRFDIVARL